MLVYMWRVETPPPWNSGVAQVVWGGTVNPEVPSTTLAPQPRIPGPDDFWDIVRHGHKD